MKSFVITMLENEASVSVASRCIESGKKFGVDITRWKAITPSNTNLDRLLFDEKINADGFIERYSRSSNCVAAFMSHYSLWKHCIQLNEEIQIFEHDAVIVSPLPQENTYYQGCMSLGKPSYGKFIFPALIGVNPLTSKQYFPGAHAYRLHPNKAFKLVSQAKQWAGPTDVFLHKSVFPFLEEYYPWPVEAKDYFTTIQKREGCLAKHNYGPEYQII